MTLFGWTLSIAMLALLGLALAGCLAVWLLWWQQRVLDRSKGKRRPGA